MSPIGFVRDAKIQLHVTITKVGSARVPDDRAT
jgi:hypothetical protein